MGPDAINDMILRFQNVERKKILAMPSMGEHSVRARNRSEKNVFMYTV